MKGIVVYIDGGYYIQEQDGKLTPTTFPVVGGSSGGGLSKSSVIKLINQSAGGGSSVIPYGGVVGAQTTSFAAWTTTGPSETGSSSTVGYNFTSPKNGTLDNLTILVSSNDTTTDSIFTVRKSSGAGAFADTTLIITVPASSTGVFTISSPTSIAQGDRVSLKVEGGGGDGDGIVFTGGLEIK